MRNSILVRSIAAVSGIVMLASVAACGDNTTASTDSSAKSDTKTETVSGNFSGAGASSQQAAVEAWIAGFQGTNLRPRSPTTRPVPALACRPS